MASTVHRVYCLPPAVDRRFSLILAASLLLHGALLFTASTQQTSHERVSPPIQASLRLIPPVEPEASVAAMPAAVLPTKVRQPEPPRKMSPTSRVPEAAGPAHVVQQGPATPISQPVIAAAAPPSPATLQPVQAVSAPVPTSATAASSAASSPDLLLAYRRQLSELLARQQEYPRVAALRGWEGEVRLRLQVARKGQLLAVHLEHSSGFDVLDKHALAMLAGFGTLPPFPEALNDSELQVVIPINYKLRKTT